MEQIFVESSKSYNHGFILKEQDLRRFIDLMNDRFKKLSNNTVEYKLVLKYKNGAVANTSDVESVLKQDNDGSGSIVRLELAGSQINDGETSSIKLLFKNPDLAEDDSTNPIKHLIQGQSRDWVFVTSSLIEERVSKIKRRLIDRISRNGFWNLFLYVITPYLVLSLLMFASIPEIATSQSKQKAKEIADIESRWKSHSLTDPGEIMIQLAKISYKDENEMSIGSILIKSIFSKLFIIVVGFLIFTSIVRYILKLYYPIYNFYWGNYMEIFDKKESTRKIIIGILLGTIFLGILVNLVSNAIWEKWF